MTDASTTGRQERPIFPTVATVSDRATDNGDGTAVDAHIELYGRIAVTVEDVEVEFGGRAAQVLALLASRSGHALPATALLDLLWPEAPKSGLNAVQRHISALRRKLRDAGLGDLADTLIVHRRGAYRLNSAIATTDLDLVEGRGPPDDSPALTRIGRPPRWWLEPLPGLPWEPFSGFRARLDVAAVVAARRWVDGAAEHEQPGLVLHILSDLAARHHTTRPSGPPCAEPIERCRRRWRSAVTIRHPPAPAPRASSNGHWRR